MTDQDKNEINKKDVLTENCDYWAIDFNYENKEGNIRVHNEK